MVPFRRVEVLVDNSMNSEEAEAPCTRLSNSRMDAGSRLIHATMGSSTSRSSTKPSKENKHLDFSDIPRGSDYLPWSWCGRLTGA
jgi:hypothetical protein